MKFLFLSLLIVGNLTLFAQNESVVTDNNAQKRELTAGFNAIMVSDGIELILTQGSNESVAVSASEEKYLERFKTEVVNGTLKIYFESKGLDKIIGSKKHLKAYVSFKNIDKLEASAGANVMTKGSFSAGNLDMRFTSGSNFKGEINAENLTIDQNSGSSITLAGKTQNVKIDISSGAVFKGFDFTAAICEAKATSGGGIRITVGKELSAKANSGGGIQYKGEAIITHIKVNSGGNIKKV